MNNLLRAVIFIVLAAVFSQGTFAQKPKSKDESFKEIATLSKTQKPEDMDKAYQLAKDFIARFGEDKDDQVTKIKSFVQKYREHVFYVAIDGKKFAEALATGKEILAEQPDNAEILMNLAYNGYNSYSANRDRTYADESIDFAKKAIALFDSGKYPKVFAPFKDKIEASAFLHFIEGTLLFDVDKKAGASEIYKAAQYDSIVKNSADTYSVLATYYEGLYEKGSKELKAKTDAKTINDADFKSETERINKIIDQMMDAYARAVKRGEAEKNPNAPQWRQRLTEVYKFRNKSDDGLAEYIKVADNTPLPDPAKF